MQETSCFHRYRTIGMLLCCCEVVSLIIQRDNTIVSSHNHPQITTGAPSPQEQSQTGLVSLTTQFQHRHWQLSRQSCYGHPIQLNHKQPLPGRPMNGCNEDQQEPVSYNAPAPTSLYYFTTTIACTPHFIDIIIKFDYYGRRRRRRISSMWHIQSLMLACNDLLKIACTVCMFGTYAQICSEITIISNRYILEEMSSRSM